MRSATFNSVFIKAFTLITICFTAFGFTINSTTSSGKTPAAAGRFGLDSYEIYLNSKLMLKQTVNQPLNLRVLQLPEAKDNDQLRIRYKHCTLQGAGTSRNITLKDEQGNTVKKWTFADTSGSDLTMAIPLKELQQLEKNNARHELSLHYSAKELPKGEMLALVRLK